MTRTTGKIEIRATVLSMVVHGAGTSGNTMNMRMSPWVTDDGEIVEVQFFSGNSFKHQLREGGNAYAMNVLGIDDGSRTKPEIDLLFSGGHLSKSGASIDLEQARTFERLYPMLSLCGASWGNTMTQSKLSVSDLHVVCAENRNRLPGDLIEHAHTRLRAAQLVEDSFGTRHDVGQRNIGRRYLTAGASAAISKKKTKALRAPDPMVDDAAIAEAGESAQMIHEFSGIMPGAILYGDIIVTDITELERAALNSAFAWLAKDHRPDGTFVMHIGARTATGAGRIAVELRGLLRVDAPRYVADTALVRGDDTLGARYVAHLRDNRDEILSTLAKAVS
jgi:hypothetical protein